MNIKKGDMISIKQDFIDRNNRYEYDSRDIWEVNRGGIWYLYWYDHDDNPSMIKIERREILLLN